MRKNPRIAICFFGITRSLTYTVNSIEKNIIAPARSLGEVQLYAHFFKQKEIFNPRSGESGRLKVDEHSLLSLDKLILEDPKVCLSENKFNSIAEFGDHWEDELRSLSNVIHQMHSLKQVTEIAFKWNPDLILFCRPDLLYHDSLSEVIRRALDERKEQIFLPRWQNWGGLNDRFAICYGEHAARAYGHRAIDALKYCQVTNSSFHSEAFLAWRLRKERINVIQIKARASRVRSNGTTNKESFSHPFIQLLRSIIRRSTKTIGKR